MRALIDPPMAPMLAVGDGPDDGMRFRRRFSSGTTVELDLEAHPARIAWAA